MLTTNLPDSPFYACFSTFPLSVEQNLFRIWMIWTETLCTVILTASVDDFIPARNHLQQITTTLTHHNGSIQLHIYIYYLPFCRKNSFCCCFFIVLHLENQISAPGSFLSNLNGDFLLARDALPVLQLVPVLPAQSPETIISTLSETRKGVRKYWYTTYPDTSCYNIASMLKSTEWIFLLTNDSICKQ